MQAVLVISDMNHNFITQTRQKIFNIHIVLKTRVLVMQMKMKKTFECSRSRESPLDVKNRLDCIFV